MSRQSLHEVLISRWYFSRTNRGRGISPTATHISHPRFVQSVVSHLSDLQQNLRHGSRSPHGESKLVHYLRAPQLQEEMFTSGSSPQRCSTFPLTTFTFSNPVLFSQTGRTFLMVLFSCWQEDMHTTGQPETLKSMAQAQKFTLFYPNFQLTNTSALCCTRYFPASSCS